MTAPATTTRRPPMDARIRERRQAVRRAGVRRRRRAVGAVVLLVALGAGGAAITRSPLFAVTAVRVEGVGREAARAVKDTAQVRTGQNLMTANLDGAVERVRALPWVADAGVRRDPPSTVVLDVTARRPVGILATASGRWLVDAEGVVVAPAAGQGLPVITLTANVAAAPGLEIDDPAARNALAVHQALPRDVRRALLALEAVGERTVRAHVALHRLRAPDGYAKGRTAWVRLGAAADVREQVRVLRALLGQLRQARAGTPSEVDVRVPANPVVIP